jgi:hypothetical protein
MVNKSMVIVIFGGIKWVAGGNSDKLTKFVSFLK